MVSENITKVDSNSIEKLKDKIKQNGAIILYHWNNCGHCQRLMPVWYDLINKFADRQFYQIELNYMQRAPHEFKRITSFPHITAYDTITGNKVDYDGHRDLESLSSFVKSNSKPLPPPSKKSPKKSTKKSKSK